MGQSPAVVPFGKEEKGSYVTTGFTQQQLYHDLFVGEFGRFLLGNLADFCW